MKAMILAAGYGKRMQPLTLALPKPLLTVLDKPLIEYHIEALVAAGVDTIIINLGWLGHKIPQQLGDGSRWGIDLCYSDEKEPLETAGGIKKALPLLGESPFIVVNGDIWTDYPMSSLVDRGLSEGDLAYLVLTANPEHNPDGDFNLSQGRVSDAGEAMTFTGISVLSPQLFHDFTDQEGPLAPLLRAAIARGQVSGEYYAGQWQDIGTPQRLQALNAEQRLE